MTQETKRIHGKHLPQAYHQAAMQQLLFKVCPVAMESRET